MNSQFAVLVSSMLTLSILSAAVYRYFLDVNVIPGYPIVYFGSLEQPASEAISHNFTALQMELPRLPFREHNLNQNFITTISEEEIQQNIEKILGSNSDRSGVYVSFPQLGIEVSVHGDRVIYPASISKVPIAVLILRDVESGKLSLEDTFPIESSNKAYETDTLYYYANGTQLTIREYLSWMISSSDNTAMLTLEDVLGGPQVINRRTQEELKLQTLYRFPHEGTAQDVGKLFEGIYNGDYLHQTYNSILIEDLTSVIEPFQDRIPQGVPEGVEVAHKVGQIVTEFGLTYADAGIVYGESLDMIVVVMNQNVSQDSATQNCIEITQYLYGLVHPSAPFENQ